MLYRLEGWKCQFLSILMQSVEQSISSYSMATFKLAAPLCGEMDGICRKFWWLDHSDMKFLVLKKLKLSVNQNVMVTWAFVVFQISI